MIERTKKTTVTIDGQFVSEVVEKLTCHLATVTGFDCYGGIEVRNLDGGQSIFYSHHRDQLEAGPYKWENGEKKFLNPCRLAKVGDLIEIVEEMRDGILMQELNYVDPQEVERRYFFR